MFIDFPTIRQRYERIHAMKKEHPILTLCLLFGLAVSTSLVAAPAASLEEEFRNPPIQARPSALWAWLNGYVDRKQITRELEEMKAKGMRGGIIWDVGSIADPDKIIPAGPAVPRPRVAQVDPPCDGRSRTPRAGTRPLRLQQLECRAAPGSRRRTAARRCSGANCASKGPVEFSGILPLPKKVSEHHQDVAVLAVPDQAEQIARRPEHRRPAGRASGGGRAADLVGARGRVAHPAFRPQQHRRIPQLPEPEFQRPGHRPPEPPGHRRALQPHARQACRKGATASAR